MHFYFQVWGMVWMFLLVGCGPYATGVRSYQIAKQPSPPTPQGQFSGMDQPQRAAAALPLTWKLPTGWIESVASSMRLASFSIPTDTPNLQAQGDVSLVLLGGDAGGVVANVNRWREQLGLDPLETSSIQKTIQQGNSRIGKFSWIYLENPQVSAQAILAAWMPLQDQTLFVKLVAPAPLISEQKQAFLSFCQSLQWTAHD